MIVKCSGCGREIANPRDDKGQPEEMWKCPRSGKIASAVQR